MTDAPIFCQMKGLIEIYNRGKFDEYRICGCQFINFQILRTDSASMKWAILGVFLGPNSPKYCLTLLKFSPDLVVKEVKTVFEESLKNSNFYRNWRYLKFELLVQL